MKASLAVFALLASCLAGGQPVPGVAGEPGTRHYREAMRARASLSQAPAPAAGLRDRASAILSGETYRDRGEAKQRPMLQETSKSLSEALQRALDALRRLLTPGSSFGPAGVVPVPGWAWFAVAFVLAGGLIVGYLWGQRRRTVLADDLLDGDEGLTADQWLVKADTLAANGHYRDAFRCIYVALLVRLAEHGVAQLRRHETNWEHVRRAESSASRPRALDLHAPTRLFDHAWYGRRSIGAQEASELRELYVKTVRTLEGRES